MKSTDRAIVVVLGLVGLLAAFWFLVMAPKRERVSELDDQVAALEASVAEQEQIVAFAEQAEGDYARDYHRLVVLGKAIPGDDDAASLIEQTQTLATGAGIDFRTLVRAVPEATSEAPAAAQTTADPPPASSSTEGEATPASTEGASTGAESGTTTATTATAVPATEASAAALPIGATVGSAGLPVLPYDMTFNGDFFEIADFMSELDSMVRVDGKGIGVDGRLLTVDGFALVPDPDRGLPHLNASLRVSSYVAPPDQGLTGGATPAAPTPAPGATTTPATTTTTSAPGAVTP